MKNKQESIKRDKLVEKAKRKVWHCVECGKVYKPHISNTILSLSPDEIDEYCEECNKKAMR